MLGNDGTHLVGASIPTCTPVSAIEPELEQGSIVAHKFLNLFVIDVHISLIAVIRLVAVPGREVKAELQTVLLAGLRQFLDQVPFPIFIMGVPDAIVRGLGRPKAETVVVFRSKDHALHPAGFQGLGPLLAVQVRRIEGVGRRVAKAPFHIVEGIQTEMDKSVCFKLLPFQLLLGWNGAAWLWTVGAGGQGQTCQDNISCCFTHNHQIFHKNRKKQP